MSGMMSVGDRLRASRERARLTLGQVSAYENVSAQYLSQLETGVRSPNVWPLLARLARRYGTTTDYLLGLTDDPSPLRPEPLSEGTREMLEVFEDLSEAHQRDLLAIANALLEQEYELEKHLRGPSLDEALEMLRRETYPRKARIIGGESESESDIDQAKK